MTTQDHVQEVLVRSLAATTGLAGISFLNVIDEIVRIGAGLGAIVVAIVTVIYYRKKTKLLEQNKKDDQL